MGDHDGKRLRRSATDNKICGVCGGIAEYFGLDSTLVRIGFAALSFMSGAGIVLYIIAAIIMPKADE